MKKTLKQIAFDLDTKMLKLYYHKNNWRKAYEDIKEFMYENDFSWIQGSVYNSNFLLSNSMAQNIIYELSQDYPYLNKCVRDIVVTNIGETYSLNNIFDKNIDIIARKEL